MPPHRAAQNIQYLTHDLGVDQSNIPSWPGSDFDTVYELTFSSGSLVSFSVSAQSFHPPSLESKQ